MRRRGGGLVGGRGGFERGWVAGEGEGMVRGNCIKGIDGL